MFENLTDRLESVFKKLRGHGVLTEENIQEAMREVRTALLEADVNLGVVKDFIAAVTEKAVGQEVLSSLSPGQQVIKIVHNELVSLLGTEAQPLKLDGAQPAAIMLAGLQGSGKTTTAAKLAKQLKAKGRRPLLVPADVYRPAAIEQLHVLGAQIDVPVFPSTASQNPVDIARQALASARQQGQDTIIIDTAGRLHVDETLMQELAAIKQLVQPQEILFVADAMTGQDAVTVAESFNERLGITGVVLTKMDGDARGGAALSIRSVTGAPVKFVGMGEKLSEMEVFHPDRIAGRILGMGDVLTLVEKAQSTINAEEAEELALKMKKASFDLEDFRTQMRRIKKLGSLDSILKMIPGMGGLRDKLAEASGAMPEKEMERTEAIINSMTMAERRNPDILNGSRRARIAKGSGVSVAQVNQLVRQFEQMRQMMKGMMGGKGAKMPSMPRMRGMPPGMNLPKGLGGMGGMPNLGGMPGMPGMGGMPGMPGMEGMPGSRAGATKAAPKKRKKKERPKRKKK